MRGYIAVLLLCFFAVSCDRTGNEIVKACFDYSPKTTIYTGDSVVFSNSSNNSDNFNWDFGDKNFSSEKEPVHVFSHNGTYTVKLVAKNRNTKDSLALNIEVNSKIIEPRYDTIYPLPYFPAFPGSYWIYSNGDTLSMEDNYELYYYNKASWDSAPVYDTIYLPKFRRNSIFPQNTYVYEYAISTSTYRFPFRPILSTTKDCQFQTTEYFGGNTGYGKTVKIDTSIEINQVKYSNVIIVENYSWNDNTGYLPWSIREYYAKEIGLIKRERNNWWLIPSTITLDFELVNYRIKN